MLNGKRFIGGSSEQGSLLPTYPSDLVSTDHPARILEEIVETLDITALYKKYSREGGKTYHPKTLLKLLFYGYTNGNRSSRKISQACRENFIYMFLSGGVRPDFRTISEFRKNNFDILQDIFEQIVRLCYDLDMISFGTFSLDGTKLKANASKKRVVEKDRLEKELKKIKKDISDMLDDAESVDAEEDEQFGPDSSGESVPEKLRDPKQRKKKIESLVEKMKNQNRNKLSTSDEDSRFMRNNGRIQLCYNAQCITENRIILAYDINNQEGDKEQLIPMVKKLESISSTLLGKKQYPLAGKKLLADAGSDSGRNITFLKERQIDGYIANQMYSIYEREKKGSLQGRPFRKDKFKYHAKDDYYECPAGEKLYPGSKRTEKMKNYVRHNIVYNCRSCHSCPNQLQCVKSKTGYRTIRRYLEYDSLREEMDKKLATNEGQEIYRQRSMDVEPTFGHIKTSLMNNGSLLVRGNSKVKGEFGLICIANNIKKITNHLRSIANSNHSIGLDKISPQPA